MPKLLIDLFPIALVTILLFRRDVRSALIEGINNFRGGPPPPSHPSPGNDAALTLRRRRKPESSNVFRPGA
jgi:hypothetical protein